MPDRPRLGNLKPAVGTLAPALGTQPDVPRGKPLKHLHWSRRWRGTRKNGFTDGVRFKILMRDGFTCRICGRFHHDTSKLEVDHIKPDDGDPIRFWDESNLRTLCQPCHGSVKQREDKRALL